MVLRPALPISKSGLGRVVVVKISLSGFDVTAAVVGGHEYYAT